MLKCCASTRVCTGNWTIKWQRRNCSAESNFNWIFVIFQSDYRPVHCAHWKSLLEARCDEADWRKNSETPGRYEFRRSSVNRACLLEWRCVFVSTHCAGHAEHKATIAGESFMSITVRNHYNRPLQICGMIFDSAPGDRRIMGLYRAINAIYGKSSIYNCLLCWMITVGLVLRWSFEVSYSSTRRRERSHKKSPCRTSSLESGRNFKRSTSIRRFIHLNVWRTRIMSAHRCFSTRNRIKW